MAGEKTKGRYKTAIGVNVFLFMATIGVAAGLMFTGHEFAAEETAKAVNSAAGWGYLAAALSTGMSCPGRRYCRIRSSIRSAGSHQ